MQITGKEDREHLHVIKKIIIDDFCTRWRSHSTHHQRRQASFAGEVLKEAAYLLGQGKNYSGGKKKSVKLPAGYTMTATDKNSSRLQMYRNKVNTWLFIQKQMKDDLMISSLDQDSEDLSSFLGSAIISLCDFGPELTFGIE